MDISADLTVLGRIPVAVVCAGTKSILDIRKTLEVLETNGVNIVVYDEQNFYPGFYSPRTKHKAPYNTTSMEKIVKILGIYVNNFYSKLSDLPRQSLK